MLHRQLETRFGPELTDSISIRDEGLVHFPGSAKSFMPSPTSGRASLQMICFSFELSRRIVESVLQLRNQSCFQDDTTLCALAQASGVILAHHVS